MTLAYNNNFWVTSERINNGAAIPFTYDNDGLLIKAGALTFTRDSQNGLITGSTLGLASDSRTYNGFGELTGYTASFGGTALYNVAYTRDNDGRVSSKTESVSGTVKEYGYTYDLAGRLTKVSKNGTVVSTYTYDTNSNRLKATISSGASTGTYDAQDRLLTYGNGSYTYTANGELASQTAGTQKTTYQYDVLGNLTAVTLHNGTKITYIIDGKNRRVAKEVNGALHTGFLYNGDQIIAQLNGNNQVVSQFVYATGSTSPDYMISGSATYRIYSDQLGSPVLVVNTSTGVIAEQITYDEFGNVLTDTNPGFQPFGFAGGLYDQDTKLVRFGARDYNASMGRWTAKDPTLFGGGDANLYGYVGDDPVNYIDPSGLDCACNSGSDVKVKTKVEAGGVSISESVNGQLELGVSIGSLSISVPLAVQADSLPAEVFLKTVGPLAAVGAWLGAFSGQAQKGALVGVACAAASGFGVALGQGYEKSFYDRHPECKDNHKCDALQDPHILGGHSF